MSLSSFLIFFFSNGNKTQRHWDATALRVKECPVVVGGVVGEEVVIAWLTATAEPW